MWWFLVVVLRKRLKVSSRITPPVTQDAPHDEDTMVENLQVEGEPSKR